MTIVTMTGRDEESNELAEAHQERLSQVVNEGGCTETWEAALDLRKEKECIGLIPGYKEIIEEAFTETVASEIFSGSSSSSIDSVRNKLRSAKVGDEEREKIGDLFDLHAEETLNILSQKGVFEDNPNTVASILDGSAFTDPKSASELENESGMTIGILPSSEPDIDPITHLQYSIDMKGNDGIMSANSRANIVVIPEKNTSYALIHRRQEKYEVGEVGIASQRLISPDINANELAESAYAGEVIDENDVEAMGPFIFSCRPWWGPISGGGCTQLKISCIGGSCSQEVVGSCMPCNIHDPLCVPNVRNPCKKFFYGNQGR